MKTKLVKVNKLFRTYETEDGKYGISKRETYYDRCGNRYQARYQINLNRNLEFRTLKECKEYLASLGY